MKSEGRQYSWLSKVTGISPSQLSYYSNGLHCPDDKAALIADALERKVSDVFPKKSAATA